MNDSIEGEAGCLMVAAATFAFFLLLVILGVFS